MVDTKDMEKRTHLDEFGKLWRVVFSCLSSLNRTEAEDNTFICLDVKDFPRLQPKLKNESALSFF